MARVISACRDGEVHLCAEGYSLADRGLKRVGRTVDVFRRITFRASAVPDATHVVTSASGLVFGFWFFLAIASCIGTGAAYVLWVAPRRFSLPALAGIGRAGAVALGVVLFTLIFGSIYLSALSGFHTVDLRNEGLVMHYALPRMEVGLDWSETAVNLLVGLGSGLVTAAVFVSARCPRCQRGIVAKGGHCARCGLDLRPPEKQGARGVFQRRKDTVRL